VMLEDGGWWGWSDDKLYVFQPASEEFILDQSVNGHTLDVAVGDRNSDDFDEIAILRSDKQIELFSYQNSQITSVMTTPVTVGDEAQRISFVDWNGDSASGRLVEGPELVAGDTVPVAALLFPPYPAEVSVGYKSASVFLGSTDSTDESMSDTISLSVGLGISFGAEAFGFKAKVGASISKSTSVTQTFSKSLSVGARYTANSEPELFGRAYAPIVMSCGCYHRYRYQTEDPANLIGGTGQTVDLYVPVGGQTQLWSSLRYNAMAEATGLYPKIEIPSQVGSVDTYPAAPIDLTAQPVVPEDMVFTDIPTFNASDVGYVNFFLSAGESETNAVAESTDFGVNSSFGGGVVSVDASINIGVSQGYSLRIGRSNLFGGGIPPIADDPDTPEDEFEVHRYSFQPYVYRQHYVDKYGEPAAFYVMNYTAAK
ncbi:MAG: hypothetical protein R3B72_50405, partial [Polyangiaceae bacterium]